LTRRRRDRASQATGRRQTAPIPTRWTRGSGTSAASFSNSSRGESVIPVVPSDQGLVNVYTRCGPRARGRTASSPPLGPGTAPGAGGAWIAGA
jgi:hypothetical protein